MPPKVGSIEECAGCPLRDKFPNATFVAPQLGSSKRIAVGEAPGQNEVIEGRPFCGGSGRWLESLYRKVGVNKDDVTLLNTIQCMPDPGNAFPDSAEARRYIGADDAARSIRHCVERHVKPLLRGRDWQRLDLFGSKALLYVAGQEGGIERWRGSPLTVEGIPTIPTLHPAAIAREQTMLPAVVSDLRKLPLAPPEHYTLFPSLGDVQSFTATEFAADIETNPETNEILLVGLSDRRFNALVVPFRGAYKPELKRIFRDARRLYGHNWLQFDGPMLAENGVLTPPECEIVDTMLAQHLLQPDLPHDLGFVGSIFSNKPAWKHLSGDAFELYCARDTDVTFQCGKVLLPLLKQQQLYDLYELVQVPLAKICRAMTERGVRVDPNRLAVVRDKLLKEIVEEERNLPDPLRTRSVKKRRRVPAPPGTLSPKTGKPLKFLFEEYEEPESPWRSNDVLKHYFYEERGLPEQLHVKSNKITVDKTALAKLISRVRKTGDAEMVRVLGALQRLRVADKLVSSFVRDETQRIGRVHSAFHVHGTNSGRLSSSGPNFQNQPATARYIYVPSHPDWQFVSVDWASIENRLTAHFAGDTERMARFSTPGWNEHKFVASEFFGLPIDEIEKDDSPDAPYKKGKIINHGCDGGLGPKKIAAMHDLDFGEVKRLVAKWKEINRKTVLWQAGIAEQAKRDGVLVNPFGRKRWFATSSYFTESIRFPAQSTTADICFRAMVALYYDRIGWPLDKVLRVVQVVGPLPPNAHLIAQVHDALLVECHKSVVPEVVDMMVRVMSQPWRELGGLSIPVDVKVAPPGDSWGELAPYRAPETPRSHSTTN